MMLAAGPTIVRERFDRLRRWIADGQIPDEVARPRPYSGEQHRSRAWDSGHGPGFCHLRSSLPTTVRVLFMACTSFLRRRGSNRLNQRPAVSTSFVAAPGQTFRN